MLYILFFLSYSSFKHKSSNLINTFIGFDLFLARLLEEKNNDEKLVNRLKLIVNGIRFGIMISNGHSPANLLNSSTRRKFAIFGKFEYSPKWSFWKNGRT
jgi:hypothetical protein